MMRKLLRRMKQKMPRIPLVSRRALVVLWVAAGVLFVLLLVLLLRGQVFPLLQTRGEIAHRQRDLLVFATALAVLVLVPVYAMLFGFAWRYRRGHSKAYQPDWDSDKRYEALWWGVPVVIIAVLAVVTLLTSRSLDPYKPLASAQAPLKVQVIATQWKWLFLYPEEKLVRVNEVVFPVNRPVEFTMTSDAPMNSFWIPQLAGQVYVMSGMSTKLHISADTIGSYRGLSSNVSGKDFADMRFTARAVTAADYADWVMQTHHDSDVTELDWAAYEKLAHPSTSGTASYHLHDADIYDRVIMKYMNSSTSSAAAQEAL